MANYSFVNCVEQRDLESDYMVSVLALTVGSTGEVTFGLGVGGSTLGEDLAIRR